MGDALHVKTGSCAAHVFPFRQVGDVEIGDLDDEDLDADLAGLELVSRYVPGPARPPNMITDSKPIDVQTAVVRRPFVLSNWASLWGDHDHT